MITLEDADVKFYLHDFHDQFNLLLSLPTMSKLNVALDFKTNLIRINDKQYKLQYFQNSQNSNNNIEEIKVRADHLNSEEKHKLFKIIKQYQDLFPKENDRLTHTDVIQHEIKTNSEIPIYTKSYRYPQIYKEEIDRQITKLLNDNIIRPSSSPWSSPVWMVPKKMDASGKKKFRMVIDYRKLNSATEDDKFPYPIFQTS